jgi:hypothetical protein
MKFINSIDINKPLNEVVELFSNPNNRQKWMEGFVSSTLLSGTEGQPGAKSRLQFIIGKRKMEMMETTMVNSLPDEFTCSYEANGVFNTVKCMFAEISDTTTDFCTVQEFQFKGFMKVVGFLMPGVFVKQSKKYLADFKRFAESS